MIWRAIRRASALLVLLPVILIGTVTGHVLLSRLQAPQSYGALGIQLDHMIPALMREDHVPGVAIALVHQGAVSSVKSYGLTDVARQILVGPDTLFQAASLSKPVTAWGGDASGRRRSTGSGCAGVHVSDAVAAATLSI